MTALRRRAPDCAPVVSSTAVGNTSVVARRPFVARSSSGSSFQLTWRETSLERRVAAGAAAARTNIPGRGVGSTYLSCVANRKLPLVLCHVLAPKRQIVVPISHANAVVDGSTGARPDRGLEPARRRSGQLRDQPAHRLL